MKKLLGLSLPAILIGCNLLAPSSGAQERAAAATTGAPGYHALVVGNNEYKSLRPLKTAVADARAVDALLRETYGFKTKLLLNATRGQIMAALFAYRGELGPDAHLLIYYAGHGDNDRDAGSSYWLPVDASRDDNSNWISADDITKNIRAIRARHVLVVADSCYSGTLTRGLGESLPRPSEREQFLARLSAKPSRMLMASGGDEPVEDGGGSGHSVFANALLRGLREMDKERFTATELFYFHVREPVAGRARQTPEYNPIRYSGHEGGDFVFARVRVGDRTAGVTVKPTPSPATTAAPVDPAAIELTFWESIKASTDPEDFKAYLDSYPSGRFAALARNNLRRLEAAKSAPAPTGKNPTGDNPSGNSPAGNAPTSNAANTKAVTRPAAGSTVRTRSGIELVYVPPGDFLMGSESGDANERPVRRVTIREGFWMGKYEVTQGQWQQVMGTTLRQQRDKANPQSNVAGEGAEYPMYYVNWNEAQDFVQRLNAQDDGYVYRLPTEAEWEYAARAGATGDYAGDLDAMAWYGNNSGRQRLDAAEIWRRDRQNYDKRILNNGGQAHPVGSKLPNAFGLFDMHGNVWEWVQDYYHSSYAGAPTDGSARLSGGDLKYRVLRSGSWYYSAAHLRSAVRKGGAPGIGGSADGFRVVAVARQ